MKIQVKTPTINAIMAAIASIIGSRGVRIRPLAKESKLVKSGPFVLKPATP